MAATRAPTKPSPASALQPPAPPSRMVLDQIADKWSVLILAALPLGQFETGAWLAWSLAAFGVGWLIQFVGHYYEGRKPAFVDDLRGLLVGPMFVVGEALFALGWGKPMLAEIEARVGPTHLRDLHAPATR